jgi:DNA (cytosine-5)-methyltransferase 1
MDLGFEGGFSAHISTVNKSVLGDKIQQKSLQNFVYLERNSFETVFANDILKFAQSAWVNFFQKRNPSAKNIFHKESIVDLVERYRKGDFEFPTDIDVVTGGFPCQDFSVAGKRKGFDSHKDHNGIIYDGPTEATRGKLYLWMRDVVEITKPKMFIAENVKGLVSFGQVKEIIEDDFRNVDQGYYVLPAQVLNVKDYGAAQNRERVIFIGLSRRHTNPSIIYDLELNGKDSRFYPYPPKTHGLQEQPFSTLKDVFTGLSEPEFSEDKAHQSYSKAKYYGKMQGGSEIDMFGQGPTIRAEHHGNIEFRRLSYEHGGKYTVELANGLPERRLSVRECARIQSFPDEYEFVFKNAEYKVNASEAYKVIGNAIPPLLGYAISSHLETIWEELFYDNSRSEPIEEQRLCSI